MIAKLLIGAALGFAGARLFHRLRSRGCGGGGGGGCHGGGGWRGRFGRHGMGGPMQLFGLLRELDLDGGQRQEMGEILRRVGRAFGGARAGMHFARMGAMSDLGEVLGGDTFDRARVDGAFQKHTDAIQEVRQEIVEGLTKLHAILRPEQRAKLRDLLSRRGHGHDHGDDHTSHEGPYR